MPFRCLDPNCWKSEVIERNVSRSEAYIHVKKKQKEKLIEILQLYYIVPNLNLFSKWTIYNMFTDLCFIDVQEKLLQNLMRNKE
ncbi:hypothetical protein C6990_03365 [Nitrosopumilus sp. b3]|uniref:hypothetical protein n=1 Tax=Nitrosopumilus sp. b3 TaxID=2109909 RepID=UPI0015F484D1|nr:hypothetical protein [Nitrosopumilus sp. b3]KAF6247507.1 hypothetical protein C6990_03365 [Nitrosopumilus sp. b3]